MAITPCIMLRAQDNITVTSPKGRFADIFLKTFSFTWIKWDGTEEENFTQHNKLVCTKCSSAVRQP